MLTNAPLARPREFVVVTVVLAVLAGLIIASLSRSDSDSKLVTSMEAVESNLPELAQAGRPLVVVADRGMTVLVLDGGDEAFRYRFSTRVLHASFDPMSTHLWITEAPERETDPPTLTRIDPETGDIVEQIEGAGYADITSNGSKLAYSTHAAFGTGKSTVVIRDRSDGSERMIAAQPAAEDATTQTIHGGLTTLAWSPGEDRIAIREAWEDDSTWIFNPASDEHVSNGVHLNQWGADWLTDDVLLATTDCCFPDHSSEPRHLVEIELGAASAMVIDRAESALSMVAAPGTGRSSAVYVDQHSDLRLLRDGALVAESVDNVSW